MTDSVPITAGSGTAIETFQPLSGYHRQAVVIADPVNGSNVASVSAGGALIVQGAQGADSSTNFTTSSSTTGTLACSNYNIATVTITGTYAGINLTFEVSMDGGTTWVPITAAQLGANVLAYGSTGTITANSAIGWDISIGAATAFRVRTTAYASGTAVVQVAFQTLPYEPSPVVSVYGSLVVGGSVTAVASGTYTTTPTTPSVSTINSAASTNASSIKTSAGSIYSGNFSNTGAAVAFVKLYNKASAPTVGTDVPFLTIPIPPGALVSIDVGTQGIRFLTGLALAITNLGPDTDTTAVAAGQVKSVIAWI